MSDMTGSVAIITGGGRGVGAGIAKVFVNHGIKVCMNYNSSIQIAEKTLNEINEIGGDAYLFKADISDRTQVRAMVEDVIKRWGRLDILVNNAAAQPNRFFDEYDEDNFKRIWEINIGGCFRVTQECIPYLKNSDNPRIINIASIHAKRPLVADVGYSATKGAIRMFTREAAIELGRKYGITVNEINLGSCRVDGRSQNEDTKDWRTYRPRETTPYNIHVLGRITVPNDVGNLALFLASPEASMINGAGIRIDGGEVLS